MINETECWRAREISLYIFTFNTFHSPNSIPFLYLCNYRMCFLQLRQLHAKKALLTLCFCKLKLPLSEFETKTDAEKRHEGV